MHQVAVRIPRVGGDLGGRAGLELRLRRADVDEVRRVVQVDGHVERGVGVTDRDEERQGRAGALEVLDGELEVHVALERGRRREDHLGRAGVGAAARAEVGRPVDAAAERVAGGDRELEEVAVEIARDEDDGDGLRQRGVLHEPAREDERLDLRRRVDVPIGRPDAPPGSEGAERRWCSAHGRSLFRGEDGSGEPRGRSAVWQGRGRCARCRARLAERAPSLGVHRDPRGSSSARGGADPYDCERSRLPDGTPRRGWTEGDRRRDQRDFRYCTRSAFSWSVRPRDRRASYAFTTSSSVAAEPSWK
jgi:hypothetical protein